MLILLFNITSTFFILDERLKRFYIGSSNDVIIPALNNYNVCVSWEPAIPSGWTQTFGCKTVGRYVIIQIKGEGILTLCEVMVFAGIKRIDAAKGLFYSIIYNVSMYHIFCNNELCFREFYMVKLCKIARNLPMDDFITFKDKYPCTLLRRNQSFEQQVSTLRKRHLVIQSCRCQTSLCLPKTTPLHFSHNQSAVS